MAGVALRWELCEPPLAAEAVLGLGPVAGELGRTLRGRPELRSVARVVAGRELLCVLAPTELLPWIDGVVYLGQAAPGLYVPTVRAPALAAELVVRACTARGHATPLALIPGLIVPLGLARGVDLEILDAWLREEADA